MSKIEHYTEEVTSDDIVRCISDALIFSDLEGIIRLWNLGAESTFGFTSAESIGQSLDLIIPERLRKAHWEGFQKSIVRGGTIPGRGSLITRALHKSGDKRYVDMSFGMVKNQTGKMIGALAVARDVTARYLEEKDIRMQLNELTQNSGH